MVASACILSNCLVQTSKETNSVIYLPSLSFIEEICHKNYNILQLFKIISMKIFDAD